MVKMEWGKNVILNVARLLVLDEQVGLFQKQLIYWDFPIQTSLGFTENSLKKITYPVSGSSLDINALLGSKKNGYTVLKLIGK